MIVNVIHRPAKGKLHAMFRLQQEIAHGLGLKVTILVPYDFLFEEEIVKEIKEDQACFGDEVGVWFGEIANERINRIFRCREPFLWLHTRQNKERLIETVMEKFNDSFGFFPSAVGAYHVDAYSMKLLKERYPSIKISIAGCFEEGVKVFHGCNHSWYLFNEGMPWGPWYPAKENSLRPAQTPDEWGGIVAVPHLCRDMALSYEGRNDFFASHPANVQRAMANEGARAPYVLNLLDVYRMQEQYNDGFSYTNVFVGPNWLSGSAYVQDSDEITQNLYREYLAYFAQLKSQGKLTDMYMSEFADWFQEHIPVGTPQVYHAKEILYGSGKSYFWYSDPLMRVTVDACQGGSIGDLRPLVSKQPRCTGADTPNKAVGSNPYLIQSQYRSGNAHHYEDGARSTLLVRYQGESLDLANYPTGIEKIETVGEGVLLTLKPVALTFQDGLRAVLKTAYTFTRRGAICIARRLEKLSQPDAQLEFTEYFKGCYGTTEYPEDMSGITLSVEGENTQTIPFAYEAQCIETQKPRKAQANILPLETAVALEPIEGRFSKAKAKEGYVFNPYYTLCLTGVLTLGEEAVTCLTLKKSN